MFKFEKITLFTERYNQMIVITADVRRVVAESGVRNGLAAVVSLHTTTGIGVNEALEDVESDLAGVLDRLAPEDFPYNHARILPGYGSTAGNPTGHIKSMLTGNHCLFPVVEGQLVMGEAQEIYLYEFDGPAQRSVTVTVTGDA